ncbi:Uncharacterised protein [Chlamydia abortus]|nr:Uncharacterised protein [Chlamydia abortus]
MFHVFPDAESLHHEYLPTLLPLPRALDQNPWGGSLEFREAVKEVHHLLKDGMSHLQNE